MSIFSSKYTGSFQTTGSFGRVDVDKNITAESFTGVFEGALSSSEQIADSISGSFTEASGGLSTRITTVEGNVGGQAVNSTDSPTFAGLTTTGDVDIQGTLTAQELIVSSSVTNMTVAEKSGSTVFGDDPSDTHQFTGSILIGSGSILGSSESTGSFGKVVVSSDLSADSYTGIFVGALSSSALSSGEQGTITLTTNGVANNVDSGLQVGDSPTFVTTTLSGLTANKIVRTDGSKIIGSADIDDFITGTANQITVTDDTDGTITLSTPQDLDTSADVTFDSITLDDLTASRLTSTDGNKKLVSVNLDDLVAGTSNQISVADDGDGTITLSTPQDLHTSAKPTFAELTIDGKLTAQELIVSSSVTTMSIAQASGSTVFGDDNFDTHHFTGSVFVTGSLNVTHTGSFGRIEATHISASRLSVDANSLDIGGQTINEADATVLNATSGTNTGDITLAGSGTYISLSNQVITVDGIDISDDTNLIGGTGITLNGDTLSTTDSEIVHDDLSGFEANEHVDHSGVTITAGTGLTGGGDITATRTLNVIGGTGITSNADDIAIDFGDSTLQTTISGSWKGDLSGSHVTVVGGGVSGSSVSSASFGELFVSGSTRIGENLTVDGTLTAQEFVTEYLTETVIDVSGSTSFGNTVDDIHSFTGSILIGSGSISGSIESTGSFGKLFGDGSDITNLPAAAINTYNFSGDNRIITSVNSNTVQGEQNLTFDGTTLEVTGTGSFDHINISDGVSGLGIGDDNDLLLYHDGSNSYT